MTALFGHINFMQSWKNLSYCGDGVGKSYSLTLDYSRYNVVCVLKKWDINYKQCRHYTIRMFLEPTRLNDTALSCNRSKWLNSADAQ